MLIVFKLKTFVTEFIFTIAYIVVCKITKLEAWNVIPNDEELSNPVQKLPWLYAK